MRDEDRKSLFMNWLDEHGSSVMKVARAYTLTSEDCQDLAQEILLQVWRSLPQFQGRASASTWIYRVALNTALTWHRKERRRRARQQPVLGVEDLSVADSAEQAERRELIERLYAAIRQLPRTAAALVLLDGLPASEIVAFSRRTYGDRWRKRFEEDLVELLTRMGHPPQDTVTLVVQSLTSSETRTLKDVPMTRANREAIRDAAQARERSEQQQGMRPAVPLEDAERFRARIDEFLPLFGSVFSGTTALVSAAQSCLV